MHHQTSEAPRGWRVPSSTPARLTGALWVVGVLLAPGSVAAEPPRWVSLGGSVTETVYALGAGAALVGADDTSFYPDAATALPKVGYFRQVSAEGVLALEPTRVLADKHAGPPLVIEQLRAAGVEVQVFGGDDTPAGLRARITAIGEAVGRVAEARTLLSAIDADLTRLAALRRSAGPPVRAVFVMARGSGSLSVAGHGTVAEAMFALAGADNVAGSFTGYRPLNAESLVAASPDVIVMTTRGLLAAGGVEGMSKAPGVALTPAGRARRIVALDDLYILGFGPRTAQAAVELYALLRGAAK